MFDVRLARYFIAVAEELHFGRAAQRLHMSQPPLSQAINQLEQEVGATLLHRTTRSVSLTHAGVVCLDHCRRLVSVSEQAVNATRSASHGDLGLLRLGAVASAFVRVLPAVISQFRAAHPLVDIQAWEIDSHQAGPLVVDGGLDIAVVRQLNAPRGCVSFPLLRDQFSAAVPLDSDLAQTFADGPMSLVDLSERPWVWISRDLAPDYHDQIVAACRRAGFSPMAKHHARSIASQLAMIGCGLGVGLVPSSLAREDTAGVRFVPLRRWADLEDLSLIYRGDAAPVVEGFVRSAKALGGSLRPTHA
jgi:DNA-binding transcriptional LysR family regulator